MNCNTTRQNDLKWRKRYTGLKFDLVHFDGPQTKFIFDSLYKHPVCINCKFVKYIFCIIKCHLLHSLIWLMTISTPSDSSFFSLFNLTASTWLLSDSYKLVSKDVAPFNVTSITLVFDEGGQLLFNTWAASSCCWCFEGDDSLSFVHLKLLVSKFYKTWRKAFDVISRFSHLLIIWRNC